MRKKKIITICMIILSMVAVVFTLSACATTKVENGEVYDLYLEVLTKIANNYNLDSSEAFNSDISIDIALKNKERDKNIDLTLSLLGNIDLADGSTNANNNFVIELSDKTKGGKLVGMYADGENLYLDLPTRHYKIQSFRTYDIIKNSNKADINNLLSMVAYGAGMLFNKAEFSGNKYTFYYDMSEFLSKIEESISDEKVLNEIAIALNCDNWVNFKEEFAGVKGDVKYFFSADKLENIQWSNYGKDKSLDIKVSKMLFGMGTKELNIVDRIDKNANYISTKLMNFTVRGDIKFKNGDKTMAKYTYELRTNLDPLELMANKGEFKLDEDDMAHFVIKNKLIDNNKEYNSSRIAAKNGIQLEIAYSPKELKTNNVLVAVNLKSLLSKSFFEDLGIPSMAVNVLPEYYGMNFDPSVITELFNASKNNSMSFGGIGALISNILGEGVSVSNSNNEMIKSFFRVGSGKITDIDIDITDFKFADMTNEEYEIGANFLQSIGGENDESKDFGQALGYYPAKEAVAQEYNGKIELITSQGELVNSDNPISLKDLDNLNGGLIKYSYTDFYDVKRTPTSSVKIVKIIGVDTKILNQPQKVKFITTPADGKNLLGIVTAMGIMPNIPCNVFEGEIILTN